MQKKCEDERAPNFLRIDLKKNLIVQVRFQKIRTVDGSVFLYSDFRYNKTKNNTSQAATTINYFWLSDIRLADINIKDPILNQDWRFSDYQSNFVKNYI